MGTNSVTLVKFLEVQLCGTCRNIPSKIRGKLLHLNPPTTKKGLVGPFRFWRQHVPDLVCYSGPHTKWLKSWQLWVGPKTGEGLSTCPAGSSTMWWSSRPSGTWSGSGRQGRCLEPLAGPSRWITEQIYGTLEKGSTIIYRQLFSLRETALFGLLLGLSGNRTFDSVPTSYHVTWAEDYLATKS